MKSTSSFIAKKESHLGGSECDDVSSVVSSSCGSSDRVVHPFTSSMSDETATPQHPSSIVEQGKKSQKGHFQASPFDSESSFDSNDRVKSSPASESYYARKSLHNPLRTSSNSTRNVRVLVKKASLKTKRNPLKSSQIAAEKATCSSMIKQSRFHQHVELQATQTEAERISLLKVCPYHHCSLHGHSHHPPSKEHHYHHSSHAKTKSVKQQISKKPRSFLSKSKEKTTSGKKAGSKRQQMNSTSKEAPVEQVALVQRETVKAFYTEKGIVLETHLGSYNMKMDVDQSISPDVVAKQDGDENTVSGTSAHENTDFPRTDQSEVLDYNPADTSCESDATLKTKPGENVPFEMEGNSTSRNVSEQAAVADEKEISPVSDSHTSEEEINRNLKLDIAIAAGSTPDGGSEYELQNPDRDSETPPPIEVHNLLFNKGGHISMWHLIQKHMASENTKKTCQGASDDKEVEDAKTDPANIGVENQEPANQEIEVRKLFAIKLVRNAIEKILLPEVQDQLSESQSITSDIVEDQEIPGKDQQAPSEGCHEGNDNTAADPRALDHTGASSLSEPDGKNLQTNSGKNPDRKSPSNWSNLKRWILLQRFVKELEKVRKYNPSKPRPVQLETGPESEKVNLRHQTVDERRRAEEWMLDYALQQVVSELAPKQKKKVALLVKAFETVVPPQEDRNIQIALPKMKDEDHEDAFNRKNGDSSSTEVKDKNSPAKKNNMGNPDDCDSISVSDGQGTANDHDRPLDADKQSSTNPCLKLDSIINSSEEVPGDAETKQNSAANLIGDSKPISVSQRNVTGTTAQNIEHFANSTLEQQAQEVDHRESPPMDLKITDKQNESCQSQLDKENYIRMWHAVYQHVASAIATKVGSQLLGEECEEVEDPNYLSERDTSALNHNTANGSHDQFKDDHEAPSHLQSEFSKTDAVMLVQEAVSEILEDTSDTQSITSETSLDPDLPENENREVEKQKIYSSTSLNKENIDKFEDEGGVSLDEGVSNSNIVSTQEDKSAASTDKSKPYNQKVKNWRKLKKLMLLRRSIKAMEKSRELKSQSQLLLSLPSDPQPEKINLRQQMIDERQKAEQWMLDYAVQHIVTKLTPARKRRVAMLVEAFEAVVPLPAI